MNKPVLALLCVLISGCGAATGRVQPKIEFTKVPDAAQGGAVRMERIAGRVNGAIAGQRIVLYAKSGLWWVQPFGNNPFTRIEQDQTFSSPTHMGTDYAALLVGPDHPVLKTTEALPPVGGAVSAVAIVPGNPVPQGAALGQKNIQFSGYNWEIVQVPNDSGGVMHANKASNVSVDRDGFLHMRISRENGELTCSEIALSRSLGYGSYTFVVRQTPPMEPATVLGLFTWDPLEAVQNHREIDIEISQWGDPASKNSQFAIQPYYVPANVFRYQSPSAQLTHTFRWEPARVSFKTEAASRGKVAEHVFTSGIPTPGEERIHINLFTFGKSRTPQKDGIEVIVEKFEYLP